MEIIFEQTHILHYSYYAHCNTWRCWKYLRFTVAAVFTKSRCLSLTIENISREYPACHLLTEEWKIVVVLSGNGGKQPRGVHWSCWKWNRKTPSESQEPAVLSREADCFNSLCISNSTAPRLPFLDIPLKRLVAASTWRGVGMGWAAGGAEEEDGGEGREGVDGKKAWVILPSSVGSDINRCCPWCYPMQNHTHKSV